VSGRCTSRSVHLLLITLVAVWVHPVVVSTVLRHRQSPAVRGALVGGAVVGVALVLMGISAVVFPWRWRTDSLAAPLFACTGVLLLSYLRSLNRRRRHGTRSVRVDARERLSAGVVLAIVTLTVFWTANNFAIQYGRGTAIALGGNLSPRPAVIIDTTEGLFLDRLPGVEETALPTATADQKYHFRYRGLRLLAQSGDRMFFVPAAWTPATGTGAHAARQLRYQGPVACGMTRTAPACGLARLDNSFAEGAASVRLGLSWSVKRKTLPPSSLTPDRITSENLCSRRGARRAPYARRRSLVRRESGTNWGR
jgi:hypothetical protein